MTPAQIAVNSAVVIDEARLLTTRFGTIPCPNCNPAAERSA